MPTISLPSPILFPAPQHTVVDVRVLNMSTSSLKVASICSFPRDGNVASVGLPVYLTNADCTAQVRFETTSAGLPTGTLIDVNAYGSTALVAADDQTSKEVTLNSPVTVAAGDRVAVVWSASANGYRIPAAYTGIGISTDFPYTSYWNGSTWTNYYQPTPTAFRYDGDSTWYNVVGGPEGISDSTLLYSTTASNTYMGNRLVMPFDCRIVGLWYTVAGFNEGIAHLFDGSNNEIGTSAGADLPDVTSSDDPMIVGIEPVSVSENDVIRIVLEGTAAANSFSMRTMNKSLWDSYGSAVQYTVSTDAATWTDTSDEILPMGVLIDQIDYAAGGGAFAYGF